MCDNTPLLVPQSAYEKMPIAIESDHPLFNVGKAELMSALQTPRENDWAADWLFRHHSHPFHPHARALPPEAFGRSLAVHIHHDISTPGACPNAQQSLLPLRQDQSSTDSNRLVVTKDLDLLLVPVARIADVTAGYSFVRGVSESTLQFSDTASFTPPSDGTESSPSFVTARFVFHHTRNDFLMVLTGKNSSMIGIVSMQTLPDGEGNRCFFVVPNAQYGAKNLPSRVLSVQIHVHYPVSKNTSSTSQRTSTSSQPTQPSTPSPMSDTPDVPESTPVDQQSPPFPQSDLSNLSPDPAIPTPDDDDWLRLDAALPSPLSGGLESIGTVLLPEDPDALLPTFLQDLSSSMDLDLDNVLNDPTTDLASAPSSTLPDGSLESMFTPPSPLSSDTTPSEGRRASPRENVPSPPPPEASWLINSGVSTPDGIGAPRQPGPSDTSAGAFDLSVLADSLLTIEKSISGDFFGPRVRKDVMDPQTGELISRCTGELTGFIRTIDEQQVRVLREVAAQSYYTMRLHVAPDNRLMLQPPPITTYPPQKHVMSTGAISKTQQPLSRVTQTSKRRDTYSGPAERVVKRVAPGRLAPLAPRQVPLVPRQLPLAPASSDETRVSPSPVPLQAPGALSTGISSQAGPGRDKDAIRESRLEAKRIKNRMSAAKSNQKRRQQLEKQRLELDALRKRVEELRGKRKVVAEENEKLRAQVGLMSS